MDAGAVLEQQGIPVFTSGPAAGAPPVPAGPPRREIAKRSFVFSDMESAERFQATMQAGMAPGSLSAPRSSWEWYNDAPAIAEQYGGRLFRSTYGREVRVYGYQQKIYAVDRDYLMARDTTARMFIHQYNDAWNGLPLTYVPEIDAYFGDQMALGLDIALRAGYQGYYMEGGCFVMLETTGDPMKRLSRGERPLGWTFLPAASIIDDPTNPANGYLLVEPGTPGSVDPLLDHKIEFIAYFATEEDRTRGKPTWVHGSRLIAINLDEMHQRWWRTPVVPFDAMYDDLWNLRDIIFSRSRGHFQGDPIVVEVDLSEPAMKVLELEGMDEPQRTAMSQQAEQAVVDFNTGAKTSFAPVMGFKLKRLGAAQLPDPKEDVMMLSSRLSHDSTYPVKYVLASTKGSTDVSDQDILTRAGNLQNVRNTWGVKHLRKALLMGQVMGVNGLRMQEQFALPHTDEMKWPLVRPLSPRDAAFTEKTDIVIYREAQEAGLQPPVRLQRKFPQDPRYSIPLWLAARGRGVDGKNLDVSPDKEPGSAGEGTPAAQARADADYQAWLEGNEPSRKRAATQDDEDENDGKTQPKHPRNDTT